jgi:NAD(P)-dependent dehydrogenase (short-subunit alcohol dehydrogenase family)
VFEIFNLKGKTAIVTGGAGGIGKGIALGLAKHGSDVVVCGRTLSTLEKVAGEIKALGQGSLAVAVDVTDEKGAAALVEKTLAAFPRVDILVNAAGINLRYAAEDFPAAEYLKVIESNVLGTFLCCQAAGKAMIRQKGGKIINLSSIRGRFGAPANGTAYSSSKGAVDSLTRTLATEWSKYNIYVNAIAPAVVHTALTQAIIDNKEFAKSLLSRIPLGRFALPEDMVGPAVFLASDASNFVTGQILYVDGGSSCC